MNMENAVSIEVVGLSKVYKIYQKPVDRLKESLSPVKRRYSTDFHALLDLSFQVRKGEIYGIMGRNGAGKSTLLKIVTGVLSPSGGAVRIKGKVAALLELGAGFNSEYSGLENIYLNGMMIGFSREEIEAKLADIIAFADIGDYINQPVKTYSSGMFARLAFAISINVDPDILIVDEALSVGDYFFQAKCYKKFEDFRSRGKTILFVSHDLSSIIKYCDKVLLLNKGQRVTEGTAQEVVDLYKKLTAQGGMERDEDTPPLADTATADPARQLRDRMQVNPNVSDYGDGRAQIVDFAVKNGAGEVCNTVLKGECFSIVMRVRFAAELPAPIFAFTVRDAKGTDLIGTNTLLERTDVPSGVPGQVVECVFTQRMDLQGGDYLLSLGCTGYGKDGELDVYHRLYDLCMITVVSDKNTIGYYDCNSQINLTTTEEIL